MIESSKIFKEKNLNTNFKKVNSSIISNHKLVNYRDIPETNYLNQLTHQIHSPVMWSKTIQFLISKGIKKFMEIGPKKTLLNFISKDFDGDKISITNKEEVDNYV
jgi:[acyl-carrier-protein] S-malonyltransferase